MAGSLAGRPRPAGSGRHTVGCSGPRSLGRLLLRGGSGHGVDGPYERSHGVDGSVSAVTVMTAHVTAPMSAVTVLTAR